MLDRHLRLSLRKDVIDHIPGVRGALCRILYRQARLFTAGEQIPWPPAFVLVIVIIVIVVVVGVAAAQRAQGGDARSLGRFLGGRGGGRSSVLGSRPSV